MLKSLNVIVSQQVGPTDSTEQLVKHFLDYCATHPDAKIRYFGSDMLLQLHSDASYLNEKHGNSTAGGHFFLGNQVYDDKPIFLNGAVHTLYSILKYVAASAAEAELGAYHQSYIQSFNFYCRYQTISWQNCFPSIR